MSVTKSEFINRVMLIMNEAQLRDAQGVSFTGADSAQIDKYIEGSYVDAWRRCAKVMPRVWLGNKSFKTTTGIISTFTLGSGTGGAGFAIGDILQSINSFNFKNFVVATFTVGTIGALGVITSITMINPGSGYFVNEQVFLIKLTGNGHIYQDDTRPSQDTDLQFSVNTITSLANDPVSDLPNGIGYINIPSDFYLLTSLKMVGWRKAVREAALANDRTDNIQSNEYTRGSTIRPVVVIDNKEVNGYIVPVLNYYSLPKGLPSHVVEEALYVPTVEGLETLGDDDDLNLDMRIIEPLAYLSASSVFTIFEKYDISKALDLKAESMMPGLISVKGATVTNKQ